MKKILSVIIIVMSATVIFSANIKQLDDDFNRQCIIEHCGPEKKDPFNTYNRCRSKIENSAYIYKLAGLSDDTRKIKDAESELIKLCPKTFKSR